MTDRRDSENEVDALLRESREAQRRMNESGARVVRNLRELARRLRRQKSERQS